MQERMIHKTGPTIFQQIVVPLMAVSFIVIALLQMGNYFFEKHLVAGELKARFSSSLTAAAAYFDATYALPVLTDLKFLDKAYAFNYFLSSQENEVLLTKPLAEKLFLHFTNRNKRIYISLRFIDTAGVEKIVTEGSKRKKDYLSLLGYPQDAFHNGISDLFSRLISEENGTILCGSPFQYQGRWTFLIGMVKSEPETGGTAGAVIFHCDLTEYFTYLKGYEFFGERVATVTSLNNEPMFSPIGSDAAHLRKEPEDKGKGRDFYHLSKEIRMGSDNQVLFHVVFRASPKIFQRETKNVLFRSLVFLFFAVSFIGMISWIISKNFSRPLIALIQTVQQFTQGDLSARSHVKTTGEIQMLSEVFNGMAEDLDKTTVSRDALAKEIAERKIAEEALHKAHDELELRVRERTAELSESQAYVEKILATITDYIYTVTVRDGVAVAVTRHPGCLAVTGYTDEEFKDNPNLWENMVHEEDRPKVSAFSAAVLSGKNVEQMEYRVWHKDGRMRWVRNVPVLHHDPSGRLTSCDGIISDITEKKQAEMLLIDSMRKVAMANKAKDQFLANMSHEVRTPLNAIIGFSCLLENTGLNPVQKEYVEMLRDGGDTLLSLISDVIDYSRIASGGVRIEKVHFDLERLIQGVIKTPIEKTKKKDLNVFLTFDEKMPHGFLGDPARIRRILMQLLSNAIKFTEKGEVEVRVTLDREMEKRDSKSKAVVRIEVKDTGIGIPQGKLDAIFDAFVQADISTTRKYGGSGLGLSISKTLVELMGGTIEVRSEPGKGSTFSLLLPLEVEPAVKEGQIFPLKDKELEGKKILILDDDEMTMRVFSRYCEEAKMVVSCSASSVQGALKWLSEQPSLPDILLVDILLPDLSGYEVAGKIRENKKYEDIKLIAVTGDVLEEAASKARQSGFDAFLSKPASRENLMKVIKTVLGDQREKTLPVEIVTQYTAEELVQKGLKILVVEDNPASQELFEIILRNLEFDVEIAADGREAVEKVKRDPYDLVLMDLQMPVMGGVEATRIIREQLHMTMPILALTAGVSEDDKERCLAAGMNDYLMKPVEVPKLKDKILHWIKGIPRESSASRKETGVMSWDKQRAIKELGVPEGLYRELVLGFIEQSSTAIQDLEKAFHSRNFEEVAKTAHFIKGAAGNLRIEKIHVTAKEIEALAKGGQDAGVIEEQVGSLKNAMEELKKNI